MQIVSGHGQVEEDDAHQDRGEVQCGEKAELLRNGHKPFAVSFLGQAESVVCALCGKYVQEKKKSMMQHCNKGISEAGRRVLDRIANGKHPDRLNSGRVTTCFDVAAKRPVSYSALLPAKL